MKKPGPKPGTGKKPRKHVKCSECGATTELNVKGAGAHEWRMAWGHRAPNGEPCPGPRKVQVQA